MSVEEEPELRDLVAQTLEANGCLSKIRAQLRASVFLALDEDAKVSKKEPLLNVKVKSFLETPEGQAMFCVVREFLEFFNLEFTMSVYEAESYLGNIYKYEGRQKIIKDLGLNNIEESCSVPFLMQLIKIAQTKTKSLEINLNINGNSSEDNKESFGNDSSTSLKTDIKSTSFNSIPSEVENSINNSKHTEQVHKFNSTFNVDNPVSKSNEAVENETVLEETLDELQNKKVIDRDDTYEDTSSIAEDSVALNIVSKSTNTSNLHNGSLEHDKTTKSSNNETLNETEFSPPVLRDSKKTDLLDKPKLSPQKSDKIKSKNSLSSLSDLPPLQMNKSRVNDILPSLYSKEFKDKSNLRELDKLFDMDADYEEDFICGDAELCTRSSDNTLKSESSKINLLEELQQSTNKLVVPEKSPSFLNKNRETKTITKSPNRIISDCNKQLFKPLVNSQKNENKDEVNKSSNINDSSSSHLGTGNRPL